MKIKLPKLPIGGIVKTALAGARDALLAAAIAALAGRTKPRD